MTIVFLISSWAASDDFIIGDEINGGHTVVSYTRPPLIDRSLCVPKRGIHSRVYTSIVLTRVKYNPDYFNPGFIGVASTHDIPRHCGTAVHRRGIGITGVLVKSRNER